MSNAAASPVWSEEALARVAHAPDFVRPGILKLMEKRARQRNVPVITSDFLTEIRNESMMLVAKVIRNFGFEELEQGAFEEAKRRMASDPERVVVIDRIQAFLATRTEKKPEILEKFRKYLECAPRSGTFWLPEALQRLERVPEHVRPLARLAIEGAAKQRGDKAITPEVFDAVCQTALAGMAISRDTAAASPDESSASETNPLPALTLPWSPAAISRLRRIPLPFVRRMVAERVERHARAIGASTVTEDLYDAAKFRTDSSAL